MLNQENNYDITIVGAGIAGCLSALLLANTKLNNNIKLKILLLDKKIPDVSNLNFDDVNKYQSRVVALNLTSKKILSQIGVWELFEKIRLGNIRKISVSEANGPQKIEFDGYASGYENLAYVVENDFIQKKLQERIKEYKNIEIEEVNIKQVINNSEKVQILSEDNQIINSKLIIAADGANSYLRKYFNIDVDINDYNHTALVVNIHTNKSHNNIARQKFLKSGPIALLPLGDSNNISIVWSNTKENADFLLNCSQNDFIEKLQEAFNFKIGDKVTLTSKRLAFPLCERHAKDYYFNRVVLLGDAAHTIHPLAGQGLNLGILDAKVLTDEIINAVNNKTDFGIQDVLLRYQSKRRGHNQMMIYAMRFFKNIYGSQNTAVSILRNMGIGICNQSNFIKDKIMRLAVGLE